MTDRKRIMVYVAGPISKGDLVQNCMQAHEAGIAILKAGLSVVVPHGSCFWGNVVIDYAQMRKGFVPEATPSWTTHEDWYGMDLVIIERCDALLRLPGQSHGADMEVAHAAQKGIPVFGTVEQVIEWAAGR